MLIYCNVKTNPSVFKSFTGLSVDQFEGLLPYFEKAWNDHRETLVQGKERRRKPGGGAVPTTLRTHEDRLFFILVYIKLYPLQTVLGYLFGMSQGRANEWIERLSMVLKKALDLSGDLPASDPETAKSAFEGASSREFVIDGTERRIQRPSDRNRQRHYYSGKKKPIRSKMTSLSTAKHAP